MNDAWVGVAVIIWGQKPRPSQAHSDRYVKWWVEMSTITKKSI